MAEKRRVFKNKAGQTIVLSGRRALTKASIKALQEADHIIVQQVDAPDWPNGVRFMVLVRKDADDENVFRVLHQSKGERAYFKSNEDVGKMLEDYCPGKFECADTEQT